MCAHLWHFMLNFILNFTAYMKIFQFENYQLNTDQYCVMGMICLLFVYLFAIRKKTFANGEQSFMNIWFSVWCDCVIHAKFHSHFNP